MAETEKQVRGRTAPQKPRTPQQSKRSNQIPERPERASKKTLSKKRREDMHQQWLIRVLIGIVSFSILMIIIGFFYDWLWVPNRAVAQVGETKLTSKGFLQEVHDTFAHDIIQNIQLVEMFGNNEQIRQQYALRSPIIGEGYRELTRHSFADIRTGIARLRDQYGFDTAQLTNQVLQEWEDRQLVYTGAAQMGIAINGPEMDQKIIQNIVEDMGSIFSPRPSPVITQTAMISPTAMLTTTQSFTETEVVSPSPTETPSPTLEPSVANSRIQEIFTTIFQRYQGELTQVRELQKVQLHPQFTAEDFRRAMEKSYRYHEVIERVKERLVSAEDVEISNEPQRVSARHILLSVDVPPEATQEEKDAAFAKRRPEALSLVQQLRSGADFALLAKEKSDDPGSRDHGGDVGSFDREGVTAEGGTFVPEFVEAAFALKEKEISDPVRSQFGWHIIQVTDRTIATEEEQLKKAREEKYAEWLEQLREQVPIRRFPENTPTPTVVVPATPDDLEGLEEVETEVVPTNPFTITHEIAATPAITITMTATSLPVPTITATAVTTATRPATMPPATTTATIPVTMTGTMPVATMGTIVTMPAIVTNTVVATPGE